MRILRTKQRRRVGKEELHPGDASDQSTLLRAGANLPLGGNKCGGANVLFRNRFDLRFWKSTALLLPVACPMRMIASAWPRSVAISS